MMDLIVRIVVNGAALVIASLIVPNMHLRVSSKLDDLIKIAIIALIFALINTYLRPIVKAASLPISLLTMGLIGFLINAAMLLLLAFVSTGLGLPFSIARFPPTLNADAIVTAFIAAILISLVASVLSFALASRKVLGVPL
jgi:putative membrane protein